MSEAPAVRLRLPLMERVTLASRAGLSFTDGAGKSLDAPARTPCSIGVESFDAREEYICFGGRFSSPDSAQPALEKAKKRELSPELLQLEGGVAPAYALLLYRGQSPVKARAVCDETKGRFVRALDRAGGELLLSFGGRKEKMISPVVVKVRNGGVIAVGNVPVGREFHWGTSENAVYRGSLTLHAWEKKTVCAVNVLPAEQYLASVVPSEMLPGAPPEALKAQAVAARSTLFATRGTHHLLEPFDICSEDHCQVYRGAQQESETSRQAVVETAGRVLLSGLDVADCRFAKTCGGFTEAIENVWETEPHPYLPAQTDGPPHCGANFPADTEEKARAHIDGGEGFACGVDPEATGLSETLFRWEKSLTPDLLRTLTGSKLGLNLGAVKGLVPLRRGLSGRVISLKIEGERSSVTLAGELNIRRALSETHLPSSCFYVKKRGDGYLLKGAGWGHGVGMCQVGALARALKGESSEELLARYYPGTELSTLY